MSYKDKLANAIKNSGFSLRQIVDLCKQNKLDITTSYISQLQTGKLNAPSERVSETLANVLNIDPYDLIIEGYLDNAPSMIKEIICYTDSTLEEILKLLKSNFPNTEVDNILSEHLKYKNLLSKIDITNSYINKFLPNKINLNFTFITNDTDDDTFFISNDNYTREILKGSRVYYKKCDQYSDGDTIIFVDSNNKWSIAEMQYLYDKNESLTGYVILNTDFDYHERKAFRYDELNIIGKVYRVFTEFNF